MSRIGILVVYGGLCLLLGAPAAADDKEAKLPPLQVKTAVGEPLSDAEMKAVAAYMNAYLKVDPKKDRVRVMGARLDDSEELGSDKSHLLVISFDYTTGKSTRYTIDLKSSRVIEKKTQAGAPVPSKEEIEDAMNLIKADKVHRKLLVDGALEGGFLVAPRGKIEEGKVVPRTLQFQLLSKDRLTLIRLVHVDMTAGRISLSERPEPEKSDSN